MSLLNILMKDLELCINHTLKQYKKGKKTVIQKIKNCKNIKELLLIRKKLKLVEWK